MQTICCCQQFIESMTKDLETRQEAAVFIREYIDSLPRRLFRLKKLDISDICTAAINFKSLTKAERAVLLSESLKVIYNN